MNNFTELYTRLSFHMGSADIPGVLFYLVNPTVFQRGKKGLHSPGSIAGTVNFPCSKENRGLNYSLGALQGRIADPHAPPQDIPDLPPAFLRFDCVLHYCFFPIFSNHGNTFG